MSPAGGDVKLTSLVRAVHRNSGEGVRVVGSEW